MLSRAKLVPSLAPRSSHPSPPAWRVWFQAIRFFSFTASVVPVFVAGGIAAYTRTFDPILFVAMLLAAVACHAGANLANDYYDHVKGIDTAESLGPSKVIQQGLLSPAAVRRGMIVAFTIATLLGLGIVAATGWPVLVLALASLAAAYFYTGGPYPLGYVALGELTVFLAMGLGLVVGAAYVLTGDLRADAVLAALAIGFLAAAILHANNVRDIPFDRAAGKVTLATLLGRRAAGIEYALLVAGAYAAVIALVAWDRHLWPVLLTALTVPRATALIRLVGSDATAAALNPAVRRTAGLHLRFGVLLTIGLLAGALLDA